MLLACVVKDAHEELTVILVSYSVNFTIIILLDIVHLDVGPLINSFEKFVMLCERVAHNFEMLVFIVDDCNTLLRIISDDDLNNIFFCVDESSQGQVLEKPAMLVELL